MTIFPWPGIWREAGGHRGCRPNAAPDAWLAARAENKGVVVFFGGGRGDPATFWVTRSTPKIGKNQIKALLSLTATIAPEFG